MSKIEIGIILAGMFSLALSIFHIPQVWQKFFPKWSKEISNLDLLNQKLINTILIALSLLLQIFAFISIIFTNELSQGKGLARGILICLSIFWFWRAIWQLIYFPPSKIEHNNILLFLNYSVVIISIINAILYFLPFIVRVQ
jgi:hypothetical protein